jgi:S1-C subfamily serine protease
VNGQTIADPSSLMRLLANLSIGSQAAIRVWREGRSIDLRVPIASSSRNQQRRQ